MPFFTIITINLNNKKGLERTIKSVLCQRFTDFEFIVVDGVSSDGSQEFILEHQSKITKVIIEKDSGVYDAMNKGLAHATGKYIQFLNSGDSLKDEHALESIAKQVNGEDLIYTDVELLEGDQLVAMKFPSELSWRFQMTDMICHQAIFASSALFQKTGKFDLNYRVYADYDWLMKAIRKQRAVYKHIPGFHIIYEAGGISATTDKSKQLTEKDKIHDAYFSPLLIAVYRLYRWFNKTFR